jgi:hypothetical protein
MCNGRRGRRPSYSERRIEDIIPRPTIISMAHPRRDGVHAVRECEQSRRELLHLPTSRRPAPAPPKQRSRSKRSYHSKHSLSNVPERGSVNRHSNGRRGRRPSYSERRIEDIIPRPTIISMAHPRRDGVHAVRGCEQSRRNLLHLPTMRRAAPAPPRQQSRSKRSYHSEH